MGSTHWRAVQETFPSLILLDMMLPGMDGWEFARALRSRYGETVPLLVMTAENDAPRCAADVRADSFLAKPFRVSHLVDVVARTLAGRVWSVPRHR